MYLDVFTPANLIPWPEPVMSGHLVFSDIYDSNLKFTVHVFVKYLHKLAVSKGLIGTPLTCDISVKRLLCNRLSVECTAYRGRQWLFT